MGVKVLYVEDEPFLGKIVSESLESKGFEVKHIADGGKVMEAFTIFTPDICVLDVMLPNVDGFTLGTNIKQDYPQLPIIYLTAKTQTEDLEKGFHSGGTDYLKKPFSVEELTMRINNQMRLFKGGAQVNATGDEEITIGKYQFIPNRLELSMGGEVAKLSHRESQVISFLANNQNRTIDRKELLLAVWGDDSFFNSRNLDVYIRKLRKYLENDPAIQIITLKGKGYHFVVEG